MFNADLSTILDRMTDKYCVVPIKDQPEIEAVEMTSRSTTQEITSQGHHTSDKAEDIMGVSAEDKEFLNELTAEENKKSSSKDKNRQAKIQRVPTIMRQAMLKSITSQGRW